MTRYQSRRDPWAVSLLLLCASLSVAAVMLIIRAPMAILGKALLGVACLCAAIGCLSLLLRTYYDLSSESLEVQHGPFHWSIPINSIHAVSAERNLASSAALSCDRLRVRYGEGFSEIYISPKDRDGFLRQLGGMSPEFELRGGSLVRR